MVDQGECSARRSYEPGGNSVTEQVRSFNYCSLKEIPDAVLEDKQCKTTLRELYLKRNCIKKLPPKLSNLKSLTFLYLPANNLTELSDVVSQLPCLSNIDVSENKITSLSPSLAQMTSLNELNLCNNQLAYLPDELWRAPNLKCLNVSGNGLWKLSPEIVHCQSLQKLLLDDNQLTWLPQQVTMLVNLEQLSLSGNNLKALPHDFSKLHRLFQLLVDMNTRISHIPITLASLSWWGVLGTSGCPVTVPTADLAYIKPIHTCATVPPLLELSARCIHHLLHERLSETTTMYLPKELCSLLNLSFSLSDWLVPSGTCHQFTCRCVYFKHCCLKQVSGAFYITSTGGVCKPSNLALAMDFCSVQCAVKCFKPE